MEIRIASTAQEIGDIRVLFREYVNWLGVDLAFQGFESELAALPGAYASPQGRLLLAIEMDDAAGCIALRPLTNTICEMKRLYVKPHFRGCGLGRKLALRCIAEAKGIGYSVMKLDTLPFITAATKLYESIGFTICSPYYSTPLKDTIFMELKL